MTTVRGRRTQRDTRPSRKQNLHPLGYNQSHVCGPGGHRQRLRPNPPFRFTSPIHPPLWEINLHQPSVVVRGFLLVNSVALHGDGCPICQSVEKDLIKLSTDLNCSLPNSQSDSEETKNCGGSQTYPPTAPIMLQHYPLYRVSDASCTGRDAAPPEERHLLFREKYDVLSKEASQRLLQWFKPRLILSGHTHSGCEVLHDNKYPEISVPSFSWRNRNNPSFILVRGTTESLCRDAESVILASFMEV
ncbi:Metallophosphoesterase 1 [Characodon lateralis]|uniref:Metallophosphoesterase 1 n=1 Tax=Characodon lateralis TaxID=208331 RepID=A0ABU7DNX5_9TELE|nr:Metallophosphoesterase 1 [Characodon lateralis]